MEEVIEHVSFNGIAPDDLEEFHRQQDKILAAILDRLPRSAALTDVFADRERQRIARESVKVFLENFHATARYRIPAAITDYLDWLRGFLVSRNFPPDFLPTMLHAAKIASHAFMEHHSSDGIATALAELQRREQARIEGVQAQ
jgi:hypothetical protein